MEIRKTVATIIVIYNLIGIITLFGLYPSDPFYWNGSILMLLFTFPVIFFGYAFRYGEPGYAFVVIIIQLFMLAATLFIGDVITRFFIRHFGKKD